MNAESIDRKTLIRHALVQQKESYAPYSRFHVAAALLAGSGTIYTGVNVENAAFSATICAERNAMAHAVACGEKRFTAIAIVGGLNGQNTDYCPPCGVCRQVMREFSNPKEMLVILARTEDDWKEFTLNELLPESFGPEWL